MSFNIVSMPAMTVIGLELRTTYLNNKCYSDIPAFWEEIKKNNSLSKIPNKVNPNLILAVYTNYTPDFSLTAGSYSLIIGTQVDKVEAFPENMIVKEIPESKYAVFTAKGTFAKAIGNTWMQIWQNKDIERTFTQDFEWYDEQSTDNENSIIKIYIAIK